MMRWNYAGYNMLKITDFFDNNVNLATETPKDKRGIQ